MTASLNIATAPYIENSHAGLMLCGVNWGEGEASTSVPETPSFFSDRLANNYPYRNRVVRWFELFGHPLVGERGKEGAFERSLLQTNWLPGSAKDMRGIDLIRHCASERDSFLQHVAHFRPRLLILLGNALIHALNTPQCVIAFSNIVGPGSDVQILTKAVHVNGKHLKQFKVALQRFRSCNVIALPHPTGSIGLSDSYIAEFRSDIEPVIQEFKELLTACHNGREDKCIGDLSTYR